MNDKNLINCLAQQQLKELDFEIKFNSSFKNRFHSNKPSTNPFNPFEINNSTKPTFIKSDNYSFNYDKNANLIQNSQSFNNFVQNSPINNFINTSNNSINSSIGLFKNDFSSCSSSDSTNLTDSLSGKPFNYNNEWNSSFDNRLPVQSPLNGKHSFQNNSFNHRTDFVEKLNFNPFINQDNEISRISNNQNLNSHNWNNRSSSLTNDLSSSLSSFNFLNSTNQLSGTNPKLTNLSSQTKETNCDLINLDSNTNQSVDKYSIFKQITFDQEVEKSPSVLDKNVIDLNKNYLNGTSEINLFKEDHNSTNSIDLNEDFGDFKFFTESFGEFKSFDSDKISEIDKMKRFEKLLNGILSVLHKSFNIMVVNYDESSVLKALSSFRGKQFYLDLREVYYVAKRIKSGLIGLRSCQKLLILIDEINNLWSLLDKMIQKVLTIQTDENNVNELENRLCALCYSNIKIGNCKFYNYNGYDYHLSCLNFYKNCCSEPILPIFGTKNGLVHKLSRIIKREFV